MIQESIVRITFPYADGREKLVRVYVPAHEEGEELPVIYMTDGQNLFEYAEGAYGCWYTREAVRAERELSGRAAIIVGIHNDEGPVVRGNDLTPASIGPLNFPPEMPDQVRRMYAPAGEAFDAFVTDTLMPAVEERFPVKKGRENTAFCGSSSGGLQSFFTAMSHPDLFGAAGVFSPAFMFYSPEDLTRWIYSRLCPEMPYLYFYSGGKDALEQQICRCTEYVYDVLLKCCPPENLNEVILPDQPHHESAWQPMFRDFLHTFLDRIK